MDQILRVNPGIINTMATIAHGRAGTQGKGRPETHHISAGIPTTNIRKPTMYPRAFFIFS